MIKAYNEPAAAYQWLKPVMVATWEAEIGVSVQDDPGQIPLDSVSKIPKGVQLWQPYIKSALKIFLIQSTTEYQSSATSSDIQESGLYLLSTE